MRLTIRLSAVALLFSLFAASAQAKWLPVHSVWCEDRPILVRDGETGKTYTPDLGYSANSWQESTPQSFSHAVALAGGNQYEFRLITTSSNDVDSILGIWDVYKNGVLACNHCIGKAYGLSGAIGSYFKIYVGTPLVYAENWHFSGYITNRFDY
jgi:hypothetical protein